MNSDRIQTRRSLRVQNIPIIDRDALELTEKQQLRKSKRIAKINHKKNQTKQKTENLPQKKQRVKKRKLKRANTTIDLTINHQNQSQRKKNVPKKKTIKKAKKQKLKKSAQPQNIDLISLNSDQNTNRPQVYRVSGRPVQRSTRVLGSESNRAPRNRRRQQLQARNVFADEQMRQARRPDIITMAISSSQSSQEYDGFTHSSYLRRLQRANLSRSYADSLDQNNGNQSFIHLKGVKKDQDQENLNWFISKNKIFTITQLSQQKIDKCDKCIICYTNWVNTEEVKEQEIKSLPKVTNQSLEMDIVNQTEKIQNKNEQTENQKQNDQHLMELFCSHFFHRSCIEKWFKTKKICPCCRKDFRKHEAYEQWDTNYEKRIISESYSRSLFDFRQAWHSLSLYDSFENRFNERRLTHHRGYTNPSRLFPSDLNQSMLWSPSEMGFFDQPIVIENRSLVRQIQNPEVRSDQQSVSQLYLF